MIEITCNDASLIGILSIIKKIMLFIQIIVPILLIIGITISFIKMVKNPEEKKGIKKIVNQVIATIIVFIIPIIINAVMLILGENTNISSCWNNANDKINIATNYINNNDLNKNSILPNQNDYEKGKNKSKDNTTIPKDNKTITFNLEHAIQVGDYIHAKENETLQWNGKNLGPTGGAMGAYTEAVNILNETDYRIYEVYNTVATLHPEVKTNTKKDPPQMQDVNNHYNIKVSYIPRNVESIKNALNKGQLVQLITDTNLFRNEKGKQVNWPGRHWGLIFYYDGTYFHMKNAGSIRQKNAIYTDEQLAAWMNSSNIHARPIVYEKK